jgi:hypothetical protein
MYSMLVQAFKVCDKWYDRRTVQKDTEKAETSSNK